MGPILEQFFPVSFLRAWGWGQGKKQAQGQAMKFLEGANPFSPHTEIPT